MEIHFGLFIYLVFYQQPRVELKIPTIYNQLKWQHMWLDVNYSSAKKAESVLYALRAIDILSNLRLFIGFCCLFTFGTALPCLGNNHRAINIK